MVGLLNTFLPLTVIVFVINVKWFTVASECNLGGRAAAGPAALHDLNFEDCGIGDTGATALATVLRRCVALRGSTRVEELANLRLGGNTYRQRSGYMYM